MSEGVTLWSTGRAPTPTAKVIARVEELIEGVNAHLDEAELREADVTWWETCSGDIVESAKRHMEMASTSDAALIARIPAKTIEAAYSYGRDKVIRDEVRRMRGAVGEWVLYVGGLTVGFERIEAESLPMSKRVQRARGTLRAFVALIGVELGAYRLKNGRGEDFDRDDETDDDE